jgi:YggT family protein
MILVYLNLLTRAAVFLLFVVSALIAATHWAVKHKHLQPFGGLPRLMRRVGDPLLKPLERRLHRGGGNPANAPYYLFWVSLAGGLALIALVDWVLGMVVSLSLSAAAGPRGLVRFVVDAVFSILTLALFIRIIASWIGWSSYSRPMRIVHALTDWLLEPLRRVIPPLGMIDLSPLVAYLMLALARWFVMGVL